MKIKTPSKKKCNEDKDIDCVVMSSYSTYNFQIKTLILTALNIYYIPFVIF